MGSVRWLLLCLLAGCVEVPLPRGEEVHPPLAPQAIDASAAQWSAVLDIDLGDPPPVLWFNQYCLHYDSEDDGRCVMGRSFLWWYYDSPQIHLAYRGTTNSALDHELLHWALNERDGDPDEDHTDDAWGLTD